MTAQQKNDLHLYDRHAEDWWDGEKGFARSLHEVNRLRLSLIALRMGLQLHGLHVVDLGCGGGLLCEPLARAGARVTGVDMSGPSVAVAAVHGRDIAGLTYVHGDVRHPPLANHSADLVLCADVLEHVVGWQDVMQAAARLLRVGTGTLFVTTINRSWLAHVLAVKMGEGLGFIPRGTHDSAMFITPGELQAHARAVGLEPVGLVGIAPRLVVTLLSRRLRMRVSSSLAVEYAAWFVVQRD